jgi:LAO/AO transport system kinase
VVNKADKEGATEAARDLEHMLGMGQKMEWTPPVVKVSAATGEGVEELWEAIQGHRKHLEATGRGQELRLERLLAEVQEMVSQQLKERAKDVLTEESDLARDLQDRRVDPYGAVAILMERVGDERIQGVP